MLLSSSRGEGRLSGVIVCVFASDECGLWFKSGRESHGHPVGMSQSLSGYVTAPSGYVTVTQWERHTHPVGARLLPVS